MDFPIVWIELKVGGSKAVLIHLSSRPETKVFLVILTITAPKNEVWPCNFQTVEFSFLFSV